VQKPHSFRLVDKKASKQSESSVRVVSPYLFGHDLTVHPVFVSVLELIAERIYRSLRFVSFLFPFGGLFLQELLGCFVPFIRGLDLRDYAMKK